MAAKDTKKSIEKRLTKTSLNHIYHFDTTGEGMLREIAVVQARKNADGTIRELYYIDIASLDEVDKRRLKSIVTGQHANMHELWDLMSMPHMTLSNGKNAMDYFHQLVKVEQGPGAVNTSMSGGLASVAITERDAMPGSEFSNPTSGVIDGAA